MSRLRLEEWHGRTWDMLEQSWHSPDTGTTRDIRVWRVTWIISSTVCGGGAVKLYISFAASAIKIIKYDFLPSAFNSIWFFSCDNFASLKYVIFCISTPPWILASCLALSYPILNCQYNITMSKIKIWVDTIDLLPWPASITDNTQTYFTILKVMVVFLRAVRSVLTSPPCLIIHQRSTSFYGVKITIVAIFILSVFLQQLAIANWDYKSCVLTR